MKSQATYPTTVNEEDIQRYRDQGFLLTRDVLTASEIEQFGTEVDREVALRTADDQRTLEQKTTYEQSFVQCMRLWETATAVKPLTFHQGLAGIAAQLLGAKKVRLWQDQALYKEPGGKDTEAHQDQTFWPIGDTPLVSAWIPFQKIDDTNGAMA